MKLKLKRPLAFFDLETTGVNVASDRIVEISILKAMPDGTELVKTHRINPKMPIPLESSLVHGIYDDDIKDAPFFKDVALEIIDFIGDADLAGYNSNKFDIPVIMEEFLRSGFNFDIDNRYFVDVQNIFHQMEQRTLKAAYKFYCGKDIENAHSAEADIKATYDVLLSQIEKYEGKDFESKKGVISQPVVNDVAALHEFTNLNKPVDFVGRMIFNDEGIPVFNFGKHKGKPVVKVFEEEPSYYSWMMNGDFALYTKNRLEKLWLKWKEDRAANKQISKSNQENGSSDSPANQQKKQYQHQQTRINQNSKPDSTENPGITKQADHIQKEKPLDEEMLKMLAGKFKKI